MGHSGGHSPCSCCCCCWRPLPPAALPWLAALCAICSSASADWGLPTPQGLRIPADAPSPAQGGSLPADRQLCRPGVPRLSGSICPLVLLSKVFEGSLPEPRPGRTGSTTFAPHASFGAAHLLPAAGPRALPRAAPPVLPLPLPAALPATLRKQSRHEQGTQCLWHGRARSGDV